MDTNRNTPGGNQADRTAAPGPVLDPREQGAAGILAEQLAQGHVADAVERLNTLSPQESAAALALLPDDRAVEILDKPDIDRLLGTKGYHGGWVDKRGGGIQPLSYARGLAAAATKAGAVNWKPQPAAAPAARSPTSAPPSSRKAASTPSP